MATDEDDDYADDDDDADDDVFHISCRATRLPSPVPVQTKAGGAALCQRQTYLLRITDEGQRLALACVKDFQPSQPLDTLITRP